MPHETARLKQEIREATGEELDRLLAARKEEHFRLRIQAATSALENPKRIDFVRKAIARIETERTRRRSQGEGA